MEEIEDLEASIYFLENNEIYRTEKPYHLQYPISGVERSNLRTQKNEHIPIRDLRGREDEIGFENNGIAILEMETSMTYEEFNDKEKLKNVYCEEVGNALLQYTGAKEVQIYDFDVRRRLPGFPFSVIQPLLQDIQPALAAHVDSTRNSIDTIIRGLNGDKAGSLLQREHIYINVWRPLRGPVLDWPLALCDSSSINPDEDLVASDVVLGKGVALENYLVHYSPRQSWWYLSKQLPSELLVFRQYDSLSRPPVAHAAFMNPNSPSTAPPRESVEVRAIVYF